MRVPFRQGIVSAPANFLAASPLRVSINVPAGESVLVTIADGTTDYLISESQTVTNAWVGPFDAAEAVWLYWDIDVTTGEKTYGYTTLDPAEGPTPPVNPVGSQSWFNTTTATMFEYNSTAARWQRKVRVFAAKVYANQIISISANSPSLVGTQAGLQVGCSAGAIVFDGSGKVIKKSDGTFYTTEDIVTTGISSGTSVKLESIAISATATTPCAAYTMVRLVDYNMMAPATNLLKEAGIYGMVETSVNTGETAVIVREGIVTNMAWDWTAAGVSVNAPVFVTSQGELSVQPQPSQAVGIVIDRNSILLTSTIVDDILLVESAVTIYGPQDGVVVTGAQGPKSSTFNVELSGDLAAIENLTTFGVAKRGAQSTWTAGLVDAGTDMTGVLSSTNGGTGTYSLPAGFVQSTGIPGAPLVSTPSVPGHLVSGNITGSADNVTGVVSVANGGTGASDVHSALSNLSPVQGPTTYGQALVSTPTGIEWGDVATGTVTSVAVTAGTAGISTTGGPITSSGDITVSLTGNIASLATVTAAGVISQDASGNVSSHAISSSTVSVSNGNAASAGPIAVDLYAVNTHGDYAFVTADQYGRVIAGTPTLDWTKLSGTPTTLAGFGIGDAYTKTQIDNTVWGWSSIAGQPTTLSGYGISDAYTKTQLDNMYWQWSHIVNTPVTLSGYGITDAVANAGGANSIEIGATINKPAAGVSGRIFIDTTDNSITYDNGGSWVNAGGRGTVTSVGVTSTSTGLNITGSPVTESGSIDIKLAGNLASVEAMTTGGIVARKTDGAWVTRSVMGIPGAINVLNGDGADGNVTLDLSSITTPGTYFSVNVDATGRVTGGDTLYSGVWGSISGKPTTVSGYGITDALTTAQVGAVNGVAALDANGKVPVSQIPALAINDTFVVATEAAMLALTAQVGDAVVRSDENKTYLLAAEPASVLANWIQVATPLDGVVSVDVTTPANNIYFSGGPITSSGTIQLFLDGNLDDIDNITGLGVLKSTLNAETEQREVVAAPIDLALAREVSGILSAANGGTGINATTVGYLYSEGDGTINPYELILGSEIDGDIPGNAANVNGIVAIANGGTSANNQIEACRNILPDTFAAGGEVPSVLKTNGGGAPGGDAFWDFVRGADIVGIVPEANYAITAGNALNLGGVSANSFAFKTGTNASGTWPISINGDAATLGGYAASYFPSTTGVGATGTWAIDTIGSAAKLGGFAASQYPQIDGTGAIGNWNINATNVTGVVAVTNGGTGADNGMAACTNIGAARFDHTHPEVASMMVASVITAPGDIAAAITHRGAYVRMTSANANVYYIDTDANTVPPIPDNSVITVRQAGVGTTTITGLAGVTVTSPGTTDLRGQHSTVQLIKVAADTWDIVGDVAL